MFGDTDKYEKQIDYLVSSFSMTDILDMLEITQEECLSILLNGGHAVLPPFLEETEEDDES